MKRFFILLLCLCLTGCGQMRSAAAPSAAAPSAQETTPPDGGQPTPGTPAGATPEIDDPNTDEARRTAFAEVLRTAHDRQVLPDGTALDGADIGSIEGNLFSVHDVDGDGQAELILLWQNAIMAGQMEIVYGYDDVLGELREELREFPGVIFYDNGAAEAFWSHNQGWAGEFWPYTLYQYQPQTGTYESRGSVDAWDKSLISSGFPQETDTDGDGMVYVLLTDNWDFTYHQDPVSGVDYWYYEESPVDGAEYLTWRDSIVNNAEFLELSFVPLTAENISQVLNVPYEPLAETLLPNAAG